MSTTGHELRYVLAGLVVFGLLSVLLIRQHGEGEEHFPPLSTYSPRPSGALALFELAEHCGLEPQRLLAGQYNYPDKAAVVVLDPALPTTASMLGGGLDPKQLSIWLRRGGRLLLLAPPGGYGPGHKLFAELEEQAHSGLFGDDFPLHGLDTAELLKAEGLTAAQAEHSADGSPAASSSPGISRIAQPGEVLKLTGQRLPLLKGLDKIEIASPELVYFDPGLVLLTAGTEQRPLLCWMPLGAGELLWLATPELASNSWLSRADNHRLLLSLLSYIGRDRQLFFDEHYHGYREQSPSLLSLLWRSPGGRVLGVLLALAVLAFAGAAIAPARYLPQPPPLRRQSSEMVLAQASLYQRAGLRRHVAMLLLEGLRHEARVQERGQSMGSDAQLEDWLARAAAAGRPVDPILRDTLTGKLAIATERQLLRFARAVDALRRPV